MSLKSGLDLSHINSAIRPQDDLFRFMNGKWLDESEIPADRASDGAFYWLYQQAEQQVRQIIEEQAASKSATGTIAQKIGDLYNSFMDEAGVQALGVKPIAADLASAQSFKDVKEFYQLLGEMEARGLGGLFYAYVSTDHMDSTANIIYLGQSGLSLPDEAYYREDTYADIRSAFTSHIAKMYELAGLPNGSASAKLVLELETQIAASHWDQVKDRDATLTYNKKTFADLAAMTTHFDWATWIQASATPSHVLENVIVRQPSYFEGLSKIAWKI
jgi:putative endopeptidase